MKTLIAVDSSESASWISEEARRLFPDAEHFVVSAASVSPMLFSDPIGGGGFAAMPTEAALVASENVADGAVKEAKAHLGEVESSVSIGPPGQVICDQALSHGVDLIVVGRRTKNWLSKLFDPAVSDYVIEHAPCAVLVIREPAKD
jgi:nucleotide-binding universal stress UspA family protein